MQVDPCWKSNPGHLSHSLDIKLIKLLQLWLRHNWEYNIKMDAKEIRHEVMDSIHLAQRKVQCLALENTVMKLDSP
jgi:hypothetical protein